VIQVVISIGAAAVVTFIATPAASWLAARLGALDQPGARKVHAHPIPRLGGLPVVLGLSVGILALLATTASARTALIAVPIQWVVVLGALCVLVALGFRDDLRGVRADIKFLIQLGVAALVVSFSNMPHAIDLAPFGPRLELGSGMNLVGVLWIVAVINAFNMTDGLDGLAAGVGAIAAGTLALASYQLGAAVPAAVLGVTMGATLGFLPHNFPRARIFLGDSGSLGVGFLLGYLSFVSLARQGAWLIFPAVLALGVPLLDLSFVVLRRAAHAIGIVRSKASRERYGFASNGPIGLFVPDRRHVHHRLTDKGLSTQSAVLMLYGIAALLGGIATAAIHWPWIGPVAGVALATLAAYFGPKWLYDELRLLQRGALLPLFDHSILKSRAVHASWDAGFVAVAYLSARVLVSGPGALAQEGWLLLPETVATVAVTVAGFAIAGLYRIAFRNSGLSEALVLTRAVLFGVVLGGGARQLTFGGIGGLTPWFLQLYFTLTLVGGARFSFRLLDHMYQRGRRVGRRVLIYGAGRAGDFALREMLANPELGLVPIGFVDDLQVLADRTFCGYRVHAGGDNLTAILTALHPDALVVSTKKIPAARVSSISETCVRLGVRVLRFQMLLDATEVVREAKLSPRGLRAPMQDTTISLGAS